MNPIIKPWPFRGWGMDMIGKIHPPSSKGHVWVLAIIDYFTKWVEAVPMKAVASSDVVDFVREHVIHRFGIPQTITTDGGSVFVSREFRKFCEDMGIKLIRSSPYYAQANGQAEASNKSLIKLIKRKIDEYPRRWHEVLSEALWAYRMSCHGAIKTSPYHLVYGQEAVLPWEITAGSRRVTFQNDLTTEEYAALMSDSIEDATELRLWSLEKIKENKAKVARAYNKKVRPKEFHVGDLVWEAVLPLGTKDAVYGKWSPNWHGPYKVDQVLKGNAYMLEQLDGVKFPVAVNGQHLKKYFPTGTWNARNSVMAAYRDEVDEIAKCFLGYEVKYVRRDDNTAADMLSKLGSGRKPIPPGIFLEHLRIPSVKGANPENPDLAVSPAKEVMAIIPAWTQPFLDYLIDRKLPEDEVDDPQV
ncbi:hypothetical protein QYE76_026987 [Lolium multiflorum]|uniref:Integrase catalytic domain-containing protein n=1 Tax=Lolium multiflorum TaxID=4521 RepID=A0AAD8QEF0_LOLMU|nr:hypothetical protein QYE76_026987 [Lolium multiflorum]